MKFLAIIPARYASVRFPGKPLADIGGKTMIQRVYERSRTVFDHVYVATDDNRISSAVEGFGGKVIMTSPDHKNGTSRALEAMYKIEEIKGKKAEIVINIQGDEPFIEPQQLKELIACFESEKTQIATLAKRFAHGEDIFCPNTPKVVMGRDGTALYFSRSPIPYVRDSEREEWVSRTPFFGHVGLYGYKRDILIKVVSLKPTTLEMAENLEQLRWLENGIKITVAETGFTSHSIDTPFDIELLKSKGVI
ncbi:MAG: 3-deoxy-manno-octulosonate cytidylyltransferase [Bacteroidales bacterium]|jgi:3-deoxy-manno-octulosonate cytidylyltransferase (CMP-KDO synthetase)|nr:3-deoxy-manno-octulosonate cytidylyltransferase [Bacteroidales bacterium]